MTCILPYNNTQQPQFNRFAAGSSIDRFEADRDCSLVRVTLKFRNIKYPMVFYQSDIAGFKFMGQEIQHRSKGKYSNRESITVGMNLHAHTIAFSKNSVTIDTPSGMRQHSMMAPTTFNSGIS